MKVFVITGQSDDELEMLLHAFSNPREAMMVCNELNRYHGHKQWGFTELSIDSDNVEIRGRVWKLRRLAS